MRWDWFRFYHDFCTHRKTRRLSWDQRGVIIAAWCIASRSPERGRLLIAAGVPADVVDVADEAKLPESFVAEALGTPERPGYLCPGWLHWDGDVLVIHDWVDRQHGRPSNEPAATAERKRRQRERLQGDGHASITHVSRESHATELDTETELDTKTRAALDEPGPAAQASAADAAHEQQQLAVPIPMTREYPWWNAFCRLFGLTAVPAEQAEILRNWTRAGMESDLIVRGFELAIEAKARLPARWTVTTLAPLYAGGVRTMEQAELYWAERKAAEEGMNRGRASPAGDRARQEGRDGVTAGRQPHPGTGDRRRSGPLRPGAVANAPRHPLEAGPPPEDGGG